MVEYVVACCNNLGYDNVLRYQAGLNQKHGTEWPFMTGAYSIVVDGQWRVEQIARYAPELQYGTAPLPSPAGGPPMAGFANGNFMIIPVGSRHVQGVWEFIKFWSGLDDPIRAAEFYTWGGWMPLTPAVAEAPIYRQYVQTHPEFKTFLDILPSPNIHPLPPVPYQVFLSDRISMSGDRAIRGTWTPAESLVKLERDTQQELARRKELGHAQ
jgi:multiple sugar transport system substrate-binding protein